MIGNYRGLMAIGITCTVLAAAGCKDYNATPTGPGYGDTAAQASVASEATVFSATGDLAGTLAAFRASLGDSANKLAGEQAGGRREVNWDGVSGTLLNVDTFPADFFNRVVPRGQIYTTDGTGFRVSDNALADLNAGYAGQFGAFSPTKIFIPAGRRTMTVNFVVAGGSAPARVNGFGVVFSDVDIAGSTTLAFFDARGRLLRRVAAPVRTDDAGFSFVGVTFDRAIVARVRIVAGQAAITGQRSDITAGGEDDLVAMDDFISGEPHAIR